MMQINMKNTTPTNEDCLCCAAKDKYIEWLQKRVTEWYDFKNNKPAPCHPYEQNIGIIFQLEIGYIGYGIYNIISKNVWQGSNRVDTDKIVRWCYLHEPLEEY